MGEDSNLAWYKKVYTRGTLTYSIPKLALTIFWMMVGYFIYNISTTLPAKMVPIQLDEFGASDFQKMVILTTIGGVLNMIICPYVSFTSDRHRSKLGRRIPFILYSMPFLVISLALFAFADKIGEFIAAENISFFSDNPFTCGIIVLMIIMFMYQFFYMYVGSVIHYLCNDIIPKEFFAQVMAAINIAINLGNMFFNIFLFPEANTWYREIFIGSAIAYAVGILLMCLMIKEGEYPPIDGEDELNKASKSIFSWMRKIFSGLGIFVKESFSHRIYILRYTLTTLGAVSAIAYTYSFYLRQDLGLALKDMGYTDGLQSMVNLAAYFCVLFIAGRYVNRWHPVRIVMYNTMFVVVNTLLGLRWLFGTLSPSAFIWTSTIIAIAYVPATVIGGVSGLPYEMLTFPRSRFGSFCSMQALVRAGFVTVLGLAFGKGLDWFHGFFPAESTFYYRYTLCWPVFIGIFQIIVVFLLYREWNRLGGYKNYACPAIWSTTGKEELEQPEYHAPSVRGLKAAFYFFDALIAVTVGLVIYYAVWNMKNDNQEIAALFIELCGSLAVAGAVIWFIIRTKIMKDVKRVLNGLAPKNGIPHHGMILLVVPYFIVNTLLNIYYIYDLPPKNGAYYMALICGINIVLAFVIYLLSKMEKGISTTVEA